VTQKKSKWLRVKEKTVNYFKTISIPGIPQIVTTESYFSKFLCLALITGVFAFGFYNISLAVNDYYKFDKITNIERVNPDSVAFPAITICALGEYLRERYVNGRFISRDHIQIQTDNKLRIGNFLETRNVPDYINYLDFFKIPDRTDCFRFNAITNKSSGLVKSLDRNEKLFFFVRDFYYEDISESEYLNYSLVWPHLSVYIGDNHLNSFEVLDYVNLQRGQFHEIEIEKDSIETKLSEPHNHCKGSVCEPYQQWNCIEACFYKEIKNKYNCSFPLSLFAVGGFGLCANNFTNYKKEFLQVCHNECHFEDCLSEKFSFNYIFSRPLRDRFTFLSFSFSSFSSLNITQIAKTDGFTFLNNIGGGLGLFMGIAFPNLIEFCQFVFELVLIAFSR